MSLRPPLFLTYFVLASALLLAGPSAADVQVYEFESTCHWQVADGSRPANKTGVVCSEDQEWLAGAILHCDETPLQLDIIGHCDGGPTCPVRLDVDGRVFDVKADYAESYTGELDGFLTITLLDKAEVMNALTQADRLIVTVANSYMMNLTLPHLSEAVIAVTQSCSQID